MIFRKNQINIEADEISFAVSFGAADVWRWFGQLFQLLTSCDEKNAPWAMELIHSKEDLTGWIAREVLKWMPAKHAEAIGAWAVTLAAKRRYIIPTTGGYLLTAAVSKKNGRPKES